MLEFLTCLTWVALSWRKIAFWWVESMSLHFLLWVIRLTEETATSFNWVERTRIIQRSFHGVPVDPSTPILTLSTAQWCFICCCFSSGLNILIISMKIVSQFQISCEWFLSFAEHWRKQPRFTYKAPIRKKDVCLFVCVCVLQQKIWEIWSVIGTYIIGLGQKHPSPIQVLHIPGLYSILFWHKSHHVK